MGMAFGVPSIGKDPSYNDMPSRHRDAASLPRRGFGLLWCGRRDSNPHAQWAEDFVSSVYRFRHVRTWGVTCTRALSASMKGAIRRRLSARAFPCPA